jgi:uncharacterized protein DUF2877
VAHPTYRPPISPGCASVGQVLERGRVALEGDAATVAGNPASTESYLGCCPPACLKDGGIERVSFASRHDGDLARHAVAPGAETFSRRRDAARGGAAAGRVHSVFKRAVNLSWHDGGLLTLQAPGALAAPFAAALARMPVADAILPGVNVRRRGDALVLGGVGVRWRGATLTDSAVRENPGAPPPALAVLTDESLEQSGPALWNPIGQRARSRLAEGLRRRHVKTFLDGACGLIGLGEGLTPAGDDCLVGALAVIQRFDRAGLVAHPEIQASVRQRA